MAHVPYARGLAPYRLGQTGNPAGGPKTADVSQLARRYTVDAIRALVEVSRTRLATAQGARVTAARALIEIGYPGLAKGAGGDDLSALHLHLLAVRQVVPQDQNDMLLPVPDYDDGALRDIDDRPGILPMPADAPPEEALALWDAYRARREAETNTDPPTTPQIERGWEPLPWREGN
jgi:hypothetical protein